MIRLEDVSKSFDGGRSWAVRSVSLEVEAGETVALLGSSGCGKTTTLKMINRLVERTSGRILVDGRDVRERDPLPLRRSVGYVFQDIGLFPHLRVRENVEITLRLLGWERRRRRARAHELLDLVGLEPGAYAERMPRSLSGGQQQRVGIARALASNPGILLMDEPFGALDAVTREALQAELLDLQRRDPRTVVFVTHDLFEALRLGDRIGVMRAGALEQVGSARTLLASPATAFVADLFGHARRQAALVAGCEA
ncbi:MAG: ABC transporter ATP-binding protein [Phycisphaerales bacterium]